VGIVVGNAVIALYDKPIRLFDLLAVHCRAINQFAVRCKHRLSSVFPLYISSKLRNFITKSSKCLQVHLLERFLTGFL
jgi:hypothetical protein